jgi:hypothetical protein
LGIGSPRQDLRQCLVDVQNELNRANPEAMQHNDDFSKQQVRQGLPNCRIFGVRGEF